MKEEHGAREVIADTLLRELPLSEERMDFMPVAEEIVAALWDCGYRIVKVEI